MEALWKEVNKEAEGERTCLPASFYEPFVRKQIRTPHSLLGAVTTWGELLKSETQGFTEL